MKRTFLIISALVLTALVACKKEATTSSNTTNNTLAITIYYGTYKGADFTQKTTTITYKKDGSINTEIPKKESTIIMPSSGVAMIFKGSNNSVLLLGGGFTSSEMKFNGTNYVIDKKVTTSINNLTTTMEGFGSLIDKDLTINSTTISTAINKSGNLFYDSTVTTRIINGSVHFVE